MTSVDRLTTIIRERLREFDIAAEFIKPVAASGVSNPDFTAVLSRGRMVGHYVVVAKSTITLGSLSPPASHLPLLVIGNRIDRRSATALREAGIQFVDTRGNAFITFGNVLIEVQGRTGPAAAEDAGPRQQTNLFSSRRSQVILALLAWPELSTAKVRTIADAAGVSIGQAHDAMVRLEQAGFVTPGARTVDRAAELLDYWTAAYPSGLGRRLELARYHGDPLKPVTRPDADQPIFLSSESAEGTEIARPATLTIYLAVLDPSLAVANRWSSSPERTANVFVRRKFWTSPRPDDGSGSAGPRNAPWPLVYADLVATGDARLREVAGAWRARCA
jgi:hypothetical protein